MALNESLPLSLFDSLQDAIEGIYLSDLLFTEFAEFFVTQTPITVDIEPSEQVGDLRPRELHLQLVDCVGEVGEGEHARRVQVEEPEGVLELTESLSEFLRE